MAADRMGLQFGERERRRLLNSPAELQGRKWGRRARQTEIRKLDKVTDGPLD